MKQIIYDFTVKDETGAVVNDKESVSIETDDALNGAGIAESKLCDDLPAGWTCAFTGTYREEETPPIGQSSKYKFVFMFELIKNGSDVVGEKAVTVFADDEGAGIDAAVLKLDTEVAQGLTYRYTGNFSRTNAH